MATGVASSRSPVSATHHGSVRAASQDISESGLRVFAQPGICGGGTVAGTACKAQSRRFNSDPTNPEYTNALRSHRQGFPFRQPNQFLFGA
jgi:hypothetical protein